MYFVLGYYDGYVSLGLQVFTTDSFYVCVPMSAVDDWFVSD